MYQQFRAACTGARGKACTLSERRSLNDARRNMFGLTPVAVGKGPVSTGTAPVYVLILPTCAAGAMELKKGESALYASLELRCDRVGMARGGQGTGGDPGTLGQDSWDFGGRRRLVVARPGHCNNRSTIDGH